MAQRGKGGEMKVDEGWLGVQRHRAGVGQAGVRVRILGHPSQVHAHTSSAMTEGSAS